MKLEVFFTPAEVAGADLREHVAVVIDVLRATSVITQAIASGARMIHPVGTTEEAVRLGQNLDRSELILCGERGGLRIEGFDLGNSPLEFTPDVVADRTLVMTTTTPFLLSGLSISIAMPGSVPSITSFISSVRGSSIGGRPIC